MLLLLKVGGAGASKKKKATSSNNNEKVLLPCYCEETDNAALLESGGDSKRLDTGIRCQRTGAAHS